MKRGKRLFRLLVVLLGLFFVASIRYTSGAILPEEEKLKEKEFGSAPEEIELTQWPEGELIKRKGAEQKAPEYAPGELIVKLKEGKTLEDTQELNSKYNITQTEKVFKDMHNPQATLGNLKKKLSELESLESKEHPGWYWQLDRDSAEYKDYLARIENEKEELKGRIKAQEELIAHLEQRQKRAPKGVTPPNLENIYLLKTDKDNTNILQMAADYAANPVVEYAEPNYIAHIQMVPNDPYYSSANSWGQGYDDLWGLKKIQCEQAWDISQGEGVIVAVVDTGIDYNHEDIAANIWTNLGEILNNGIDDDGNGFVDDVRGYDFVSFDDGKTDADPMDGHGHGTHVAGTIAAVGNNNKGVIGVAPKAKVMAVKGLSDRGSGYDTDLANCLRYAADMGADAINNSWGSRGSSQMLEEAVNYAHSKGCVVVAAAGNDNGDVSYFFPAGLTNVITVASTDHNDLKSFFSNWGSKIDFAAPGEDILSIVANVDYGSKSGTSMACPHVAGLVALILSRNSFLTEQEVYQIIQNSADDLGYSNCNWGLSGDTPLIGDFNGDGKDDIGIHRASTAQWFVNLSGGSNFPGITFDTRWSIYFGYGRINAYKAISSTPLVVDTTPPTIPGTPILSSGANPNNAGTFSITWTASVDTGSGLKGYDVYRNGVYVGFEGLCLDCPSPPTTETWFENNLPQGSYTYYIVAVDKAGNRSNVSSTSQAILVDKTSPTGKILIKNNATYIRSTSVTLNLSATDTGGSGLNQMMFSNDNISWSAPEVYATTKAWLLTSTNGTKIVYVKFSDKAGNWSTVYSDTIILDTTRPTITNITDLPDPFDPEAGQLTKISYTLSDNLSNSLYVYVYIYNSAGTWVRTLGRYTQSRGVVSSATWNGKNSSGYYVPDGTYKYRIRAQDMAGNYVYSGYYYVTKR